MSNRIAAILDWVASLLLACTRFGGERQPRCDAAHRA